MNRRKMMAWVLLITALGCGAALAEVLQPREVTTRVVRVAVFKSGMGYFQREGELPKEAGPFFITSLPTMSHGTFWYSHDPSAVLKGLVARKGSRTEAREATSVVDILRANAGKKAKLYVPAGEPVVGIIGAITDEVTPVESDLYATGDQRTTPYYRPGAPGGELLLVKADIGVVAVDPRGISRVDILDPDAATSLHKEVETIELTGVLDAAPKKTSFGINYVAKGIAWAPSYKIDISEEKDAMMQENALVMNEVEDLQDVSLLLVAGFPHIQFGDVPSPISLKLTLAQFLRYLAKLPQAGPVPQIMAQAAYAYAAAAEVIPEYSVAGEAREDLFLFRVDGVSLAKGEVAYYPVMRDSVSYRHVYQWNIPDYVNEQDRYQRRDERASENQPPVWHVIKLKNETELPWTTAPAMTISEEQVVGQDTLSYTPIGGTAVLKLTRAADVSAEEQELEVERVRAAMTLYGDAYDKITVQGKLRVENFKAGSISMEIIKTLSGEVTSSTPTAEVRQLARGLSSVNPTAELKWELEVGAGEEKELAYSYTVLVRR